MVWKLQRNWSCSCKIESLNKTRHTLHLCDVVCFHLNWKVGFGFKWTAWMRHMPVLFFWSNFSLAATTGHHVFFKVLHAETHHYQREEDQSHYTLETVERVKAGKRAGPERKTYCVHPGEAEQWQTHPHCGWMRAQWMLAAKNQRGGGRR